MPVICIYGQFCVCDCVYFCLCAFGGQGSHASVAECTLAPLFIRIFAGSTDRESVIPCIVCRDGPVFTLVGVLCAGSSQNSDTLDFDFYVASCCELWASAIVPGRWQPISRARHDHGRSGAVPLQHRLSRWALWPHLCQIHPWSAVSDLTCTLDPWLDFSS